MNNALAKVEANCSVKNVKLAQRVFWRKAYIFFLKRCLTPHGVWRNVLEVLMLCVQRRGNITARKRGSVWKVATDDSKYNYFYVGTVFLNLFVLITIDHAILRLTTPM